ncbi:MAG: RseA family anti-sigma factor [Limnobacter sp.]|nr:RseA family anti-sigma factor [Limnobacter sp.]
MGKLEQISTLVDGEMSESEIKALLLQMDDEDQSAWNSFQLIGDVLRSESLTAHHQPDLVDQIALMIEQEPTIVAPVLAKTLADRRKMIATFAAAKSLKLVASVAAVVVVALSINTFVPAVDSEVQMVMKTRSAETVNDKELALWQEYFSAHQQNAVQSGLAGVSPIARVESDKPVLNDVSSSVVVSRSDAKEWMNVWTPEQETGLQSVQFQYVSSER